MFEQVLIYLNEQNHSVNLTNMRRYLSFLLALMTINCYSQNEGKILLVPMKTKSVEFNKNVVKMLKHNHLNIDSLKSSIVNSTINKLTNNFPKYTFDDLQSDSSYSYLVNNADVLSQWNSIYLKRISGSKGFEKVFLTNNEDAKLKYYGRNISENDSVVYSTLIKKHNYKYIWFINKFETIKRGKSYFCLHIEIYDSGMNKIYGSKNYRSVDIYSEMYLNVFNHYVKSTVDDHCNQIGNFLKVQD